MHFLSSPRSLSSRRRGAGIQSFQALLDSRLRGNDIFQQSLWDEMAQECQAPEKKTEQNQLDRIGRCSAVTSGGNAVDTV